MPRALLPGRWNRHGRAIPDAQLHEMDCDVAPDAERCIRAPVRTPEDDAYILHVRRLAVLLAVLAWAGLAALLELFGAREFRL